MNQEYNPQTVYMIQTIKNTSKCYYSRGIFLAHIPFSSVDCIQLQKITIVGKQQYWYDLFPAFCRFQRAWRRRYKFIKSCIKLVRTRELTGQQFYIPAFLE